MLELKLKQLRLADLQLFICAANFNNLGKAAKLQFISQSAASAAVLRVEEALGYELCLHKKRQFQLSRKGEQLLPFLEAWLQQLNDIVGIKKNMPLRISTTQALGQIIIPPLLTTENLEFKQRRPDQAFIDTLNGETDIALVLDNAPWKGVFRVPVAKGYFRLYASKQISAPQSVLLPDDQMEVVEFQQRWLEEKGSTIAVRARISSWTLIASICEESKEVGFLPDFLGKKRKLKAVEWQGRALPYRILALYKREELKQRVEGVVEKLKKVFSRL